MLIRAGALSQDQPGDARGGRLTARDHAQRFLDACPEDVRAAARIMRHRSHVDLYWSRPPLYWGFQMVVFWDGGIRIPRRIGGSDWTTVDRLLSGYTHPQDRSPANESTATATTRNSQGLGKRIPDSTHG